MSMKDIAEKSNDESDNYIVEITKIPHKFGWKWMDWGGLSICEKKEKIEVCRWSFEYDHDYHTTYFQEA